MYVCMYIYTLHSHKHAYSSYLVWGLYWFKSRVHTSYGSLENSSS